MGLFLTGHEPLGTGSAIPAPGHEPAQVRQVSSTIRRIVSAAPPLTPAQHDRVAGLLRPGGAIASPENAGAGRNPSRPAPTNNARRPADDAPDGSTSSHSAANASAATATTRVQPVASIAAAAEPASKYYLKPRVALAVTR